LEQLVFAEPALQRHGFESGRYYAHFQVQRIVLMDCGRWNGVMGYGGLARKL
jgi:hypothetical protein